MNPNRLIGAYPVIGIRPTIDGRRGALKIRESLEAQTMGMAKAAARLFTENLRYSNGEPVKVILADSTIGRVAEAAAAAEKFRREGVSITLTVTPCWCYGAETMDMDPHTIKGVWGFNGTERPGAVYLASVLASHAQKGLPAFGIYGKDVQEAGAQDIPADVREKLLRFGRAAVAAAARSYLGAQYRWGGRTPLGIDCSGLAFMAYRLNGVTIYRDARMEPGFPVHPIPLSRMDTGDLIFFPGHVAVYLGRGRYIHSTARAGSDGVVINSLDPEHSDYREDLARSITAVGSIF